MSEYASTEEKFLKDAENHIMTIIRDDGVSRHIRFRKKDQSAYWFDLITWPETLCIDGDMGTYVFRRLHDMFEFFRTDREFLTRKGNKLAINPSYWAEKVQAQAVHGGIKEFDEDRFNAAIREYLVNWMRDHRDDTDKDERRELWDAVMSEVIGADGDSGGYRKQVAAHDFHHTVRKGMDFYFQDLWETNVERYSYGFIWNCYAIAWGIKTYDESKKSGS